MISTTAFSDVVGNGSRAQLLSGSARIAETTSFAFKCCIKGVARLVLFTFLLSKGWNFGEAVSTAVTVDCTFCFCVCSLMRNIKVCLRCTLVLLQTVYRLWLKLSNIMQMFVLPEKLLYDFLLFFIFCTLLLFLSACYSLMHLSLYFEKVCKNNKHYFYKWESPSALKSTDCCSEIGWWRSW